MLLLCLLAASAVAYTHPTTRIYGVVGFALAAYQHPFWTLALCFAACVLAGFTRAFYRRLHNAHPRKLRSRRP